MSNPSAALERPALVLNRNWVPIHQTTGRHALVLLYKAVVRAVNPVDCSLHRFGSWSDLRVSDDAAVVSSVSFRIIVPDIVVLDSFSKIPRRRVPFNRRNLFERDRSTCQYCGKHEDPETMTIDHILPRSRGGTSSWKNCVIACVHCNLKKRDRTPREAGMLLARTPVLPTWSPKLLMRRLPRLASWERVIGEAYWSVELER
ncbi:MAG: HNH endonuclease [Gemmatimonadota bacterium]|jgi:5-methylcytosine-specific restriction endonuclease McrA|nr:HNH endonuclease [Gemmatimonadota bacterium]MDP6802628.1 HNH endonuclease [Gemmatimonadota bacterium]MDP7030753.1 HNH endonuclease [Gemmatimonadota bacterium]